MKALFFIFLACFVPFFGYNQSAPLTKVWDKTFGGTGEDTPGFKSIVPTSEGGFILGGSSNSNQGGDKSDNSKGGTDYWVIKIDGEGNKIWDKTFGGNMDDYLQCVSQTTDNGYLLTGFSISNASDDKSEDRKGSYDYWIVKIDLNGNKVWDKSFGGNRTNDLVSTIPISNGGFLLAGYSNSDKSIDKSGESKGKADYWIIKIDSNGNKVWDKSFGGESDDFLYSCIPTSDGGYLLAGYSASSKSEDKSEDSKGLLDYWIVKIDTNGNKIWDKTLGGNKDEELWTIIATQEGGVLLGGTSESDKSGDKSEDNKGIIDYWIVKIDSIGNKLWDKSFGGSRINRLRAMSTTVKNEILLAGYSNSSISEDKSENSNGKDDYWIIRIDTDGNKLWDKSYGGNQDDGVIDIFAISADSYILAGSSNSPLGGDKSEDSKGGTDWWIIKIQESDSCTMNLNLIPSDVLCAGTSTGSIQSQVTNGTPPFEFALNETDFQADSVFNNLRAGSYTVKVRDASGCIKTEQVTLQEPRPLRFLIFTQRKTTCPTCEDGVIVAQGIGGMAPYTFSANAKPFSNNVLAGLAKSTYEVVIQDSKGCAFTRSIEVK